MKVWGTTGKPGAIAKQVIVPVLLVLASIMFVIQNAPPHERMSPFDEYVYIDYLAKFPEQGVIHRGEQTGDLARQYYSCHGVEVFGKIAPDNCKTHDFDQSEEYPFGGVNSADIYTPLYFGVTWAVAQPIMWATGTDLVSAGRLAGAFWLSAAAVMLHLALRRLKISPLLSFAAPLLLIASISTWWAATYISTDATAPLAGAALLYIGVRYAQSNRGTWWLICASVIAVAFKFQNFMAVVLTAGMLLLVTLAKKYQNGQLPPDQSTMRPASIARAVWISAGMLTLPLLFQIAWLGFRTAAAVGPPPDQQTGSALGVAQLVQEMFKFFGNVSNAMPVNSEATLGWALSTTLSWLLIAGVLGTFAAAQRWSVEYSLAAAWIAAAACAGPALALATRITEGYYFALPSRYGISLLPAALALSTVLFDKKIETRVALATLAIVTFSASLTPYYPGTQLLG